MEYPDLFQAVGPAERLTDLVLRQIQGLILENKIRPGMKLPSERELAEMLGVSRTVVREATGSLATMGLVEIRPGVGIVVRSLNTDKLAASLSLLLRAREGGISFDHLHEVRSVLEVEIAGLAAERATEEDVAALEEVYAKMDVAEKDSPAFAAGDVDLHRTLARATHNPLFVALMDSIQDVLLEQRLRVAALPDLARKIMPYHRDILDRVKAKDPEGARDAMRRHLIQARQIFYEASLREGAEDQ